MDGERIDPTRDTRARLRRRIVASPAPSARPAFAVREVDGRPALHLTPCPLPILADALDDLGVDAVRAGRDLRFPTVMLAGLRPPFRVRSDRGEAEDPDAFAIQAGDVAVIAARSRRVLRAALRRWLAAHLDGAGVAFGLDGVGDPALDALLATDGWTEPRLARGRRTYTLAFPARAAPGSDPVGGHDPECIRWIGADRSGWRTDWAW